MTALNFIKVYIYLEVLLSMCDKKWKAFQTLYNINQNPEYSSEVEKLAYYHFMVCS